MPDIILGGFSTDVTPPEVTAWAPTGTGVARAANVVFDIWDEETGVDTDSLNVTVGGLDAVIAGVIQLADFTGSITDMGSGTWRVTLNPNVDFPNYDDVEVKVNAQDLAPSPNIMDEFAWSFETEDDVAPSIYNNAPTGVDVSVGVYIQFWVVDDGSGVDLVNTIVTVNGTTVYDWDGSGLDPNAGFKSGWENDSYITPLTAPPATFPGFAFEIKKNVDLDEWTDHETIVATQDVAGNPAGLDWTFKTEDVTAPTIDNLAPTGTGVPVDTPITFDVKDFMSGVNMATLDVVIDGNDAVINGVAQLGYSLGTSDIPGGKSCTVGHPSLPGYEDVDVSIYIEDNSGNDAIVPWTFTTEDIALPWVENNSPTGTGVLVNTNVSFDVLDLASGIDLATLVITIGGSLVYDWDGIGPDPKAGFKSGWNGSGSDIVSITDGYHVVIDKTTDYVELTDFEVIIDVSDIAGNVMPPYSWSFRTGSSDFDNPYITNRLPIPNTGSASVNTSISFILRDVSTGINLSSVIVEINGVLAYTGGLAQSGFTVDVEPIVHAGFSGWVNDYQFVIHPEIPFEVLDEVTVDIYAEDLGQPRSLSVTYSFIVGAVAPIAIIAKENIDARIGSMIQLDGRRSYDPNGLPITFAWSFTRKPIGSTVSTLTSIIEGSKAVSFVPDKIGAYEVQLVVNNGYETSEPATAVVTIGLTQTLCGKGLIPDASFLWNAISNSWALASDKDYITSIWSAAIQTIGSDMLKLWANDYAKSLKTTRNTVPRHWQKFELYTDLRDYQQRVIVGYTNDGTRGRSGAVNPSSDRETIGQGSVATGQTFTATLTALDGYIVIPGSIALWLETIQVGADDGEGHIVGVGGYGVGGQIDYTTKAIVVSENVGVNIWGVGDAVEVSYQSASENTDSLFITTKDRKKLGDGSSSPSQLFTSGRSVTLGTGSPTINKAFSGYLAIPGDSSVIPGTVEVYNGATKVGVDDGEGNLIPADPLSYNMSGTVDYDSGLCNIKEHALIWNTGDNVDVDYHVDILQAPLERGLTLRSISVLKKEVSTGVFTTVATDDGSGTISGTDITGWVDYDLSTFEILETADVFGVGTEAWIEFESSDLDLTTLDRNKNARGRVLVVNGDGFTVSRVYNTETETVIVVNEVAIPGGLTNATWRLPHTLHVPALNLEDFNVRTGDVIVFDVTRKDIGLSGELRAQVIGVDRDRVGFEFTTQDLSVKSETVDRAQFKQLVKDLRIAAPSASEDEVTALSEVFLGFMPIGINLSERPFTPFRVVMRARHIIHNKAIRVHSRYISVPSLQESLFESTAILKQNYDYIVGDGEIEFVNDLFSPSSPAPEALWAECSMIDNTQTIENNFGVMVDLKSADFQSQLTRVSYLSAVRGLWYAITNGPTIFNIRLGLQIFLGLPFAEERGVILRVDDSFTEEENGLVLDRLLVEEVDEYDSPTGRRHMYFYPKVIGLETNPATDATYKIGDILEQWAPISKGVEVEDYVKDPLWWTRTLSGLEILKFFVFKISIDGDVFNSDDVALALNFINKIKPAYTRVLTAAVRTLDEDILAGFEESIQGIDIVAQFYDNGGGGNPAFRLDQFSRQGVTFWKIGSRPFVTRSSNLLTSVITKAGTGVYAGKVLASSAVPWRENGVFTQENIGTGTGGLNDTFIATLTLAAGSRVRPRSVVVRRNGTGVTTGDAIAWDNGLGYISSGDGKVDGTINYDTGEILVAEKGFPIWGAGNTADVDFYAVGEDASSEIRGRSRPDPSTFFPLLEGDILVILRGQPGAFLNDNGYYEVEEVTAEGDLVLRNVARPEDLGTVDYDGTFEREELDPDTFPYSENLKCSIIRRLTNPLAQGGLLTTSAGTGNVTDTNASFIQDGVRVDDHLVIEIGTDTGEYRIATLGATSLSVVQLDGTAVTFTGSIDLRYRIIRPTLGLNSIHGAKIFHNTSLTRVEVLVQDTVAPGTVVLDFFSPAMVGHTLNATDAENPLNNGIFQITEYVNAGCVVVDAAYVFGQSDLDFSARVAVRPYQETVAVNHVIWHEGWHRGFEKIVDLYPSEVVELETTTT